ncbi:hypothetical protein ScPMuIL_013741 [Solemya velum]
MVIFVEKYKEGRRLRICAALACIVTDSDSNVSAQPPDQLWFSCSFLAIALILFGVNYSLYYSYKNNINHWLSYAYVLTAMALIMELIAGSLLITESKTFLRQGPRRGPSVTHPTTADMVATISSSLGDPEVTLQRVNLHE